MNIKILRLKNGDDIICDMERDGDLYFINNPMEIWMEGNGKVPKLCMDHWFPLQVIVDNASTLSKDDVLLTLIPNEQLTEYYTNQIDELNSVLHTKDMADKMSDEELIDTIMAIQEGSGSTFH